MASQCQHAGCARASEFLTSSRERDGSLQKTARSAAFGSSSRTGHPESAAWPCCLQASPRERTWPLRPTSPLQEPYDVHTSALPARVEQQSLPVSSLMMMEREERVGMRRVAFGSLDHCTTQTISICFHQHCMRGMRPNPFRCLDQRVIARHTMTMCIISPAGLRT